MRCLRDRLIEQGATAKSEDKRWTESISYLEVNTT